MNTYNFWIQREQPRPHEINLDKIEFKDLLQDSIVLLPATLPFYHQKYVFL